MYFPSAATYITIPSDVLQALVLTHRMFDYYIVHCIVAQVQLEAQNHQHRPCKMGANRKEEIKITF